MGRWIRLGSTIQVRYDETTFDFVVTGIVADPPAHTHLQFEFLASFVSMRTMYGDWIDDPRNWEHPPLFTYAMLREGVTTDALDGQLPALASKRMGLRRTASRSLHVERLHDIHLRSNRQGDLSRGGSIQSVYLLTLIGLLILVVACINYVNLATARAASRSREIGMRKALGAGRSQLMRQFLMEAILTAFAASVVALLMVAAALPVFREVSGKAVPLDLVASWWTPLGIVAVLAFVGFAAGGYPAVYLVSQQPGRMLKGRRHAGSEAFVRRGLVVFQYAVSVVLIAATLVVMRQLDFMMNERLGFKKEHVVVVPIRDMEKQMASSTLLELWRNIRGVQAATVSSGMPGLEAGLHDFMVFPERASQDSLSMNVLSVDHDYVETYGLEITDGRDFDENHGSDVEGGFLINESAARLLGWHAPVGQRLRLRYYFYGEKMKRGEIVGVVRDFQYHSLHRGADPILFHIIPNSYYYDFASARLDAQQVAETLKAMEAAWNTFNPSRPFEYHFLDEQFDALYRAEHRLGRLFSIFAAISIFTACLGLFGLAAYSIQERTKEIGIRKVLGAGVGSIVALISRDFVRMVLAACCIALPVSYVLMAQWLESFASRVDLGVGVFALSTFIVLALALATVGVHTLRAGLSDPVENLRHE